MSSTQRPLPVLAIIGGGLAGTLAAIQTIRTSKHPLIVRIFEPEAELGRGLAYATPDYNHKLNGPAKAFGLRPDDPLHFAHWLEHAARAAPWKDFEDGANAFAPRWIYGDYVSAELVHALDEAQHRVVFEHVRAKVDDIHAHAGGLSIVTEDGLQFDADHVVLALGVFPTRSTLIRDQRLLEQGLYLPNPWQPAQLERLLQKDSVLLIGSSLTMIDTVVALEARGYRGTYEVVSRRGLTPEARREPPVWPEFIEVGALHTARSLLRSVREQLRKARAQDDDWQRLVLAVRPHLASIWSRLSIVERRRFMRHVRPFWDVFLHRAPPPSALVIDAVRAAGRLRAHAASLQRIELGEAGRVSVQYRPRGTQQVNVSEVDAVVNCVGFEYLWERVTDEPLVKSLLARGLVRPSSIELGIDADPGSLAVIDATGVQSSRISAIGLPLRGVLFESGTIGELLRQAVLLAPRLSLCATPAVPAAPAAVRSPDELQTAQSI